MFFWLYSVGAQHVNKVLSVDPCLFGEAPSDPRLWDMSSAALSSQPRNVPHYPKSVVPEISFQIGRSLSLSHNPRALEWL